MGTMTPKRSSISVLIANPHSIARELLVGALQRHRHFNVADSATTTQEVLDAVKSAEPDVALITANLADGPLSGFGALRKIREQFPRAKTIILLSGSERSLVVDAFRAGARGVFGLSQSTFKLLCRCVECVHAGQVWANSSELVEVIEAFAHLAPMRVVNADGMRLLTKREEDVVCLLAEGLQNRDIARELGLSEHTVKNYLFHIFDKLGVSSRVELVLYAVSSTKRSLMPSVQSSELVSELAAGMKMDVNPQAGPGNGSSARALQAGRKKRLEKVDGIEGQVSLNSILDLENLCV